MTDLLKTGFSRNFDYYFTANIYLKMELIKVSTVLTITL